MWGPSAELAVDTVTEILHRPGCSRQSTLSLAQVRLVLMPVRQVLPLRTLLEVAAMMLLRALLLLAAGGSKFYTSIHRLRMGSFPSLLVWSSW